MQVKLGKDDKLHLDIRFFQTLILVFTLKKNIEQKTDSTQGNHEKKKQKYLHK